MSKKAILEQTLTNIGNAIRANEGITDLMTPSEMVTAIADLNQGSYDSTPFSLVQPQIDGSFTGFASDDEEALWFDIFADLTSLSYVITNLTVNLTIDFSVHSFAGSGTWSHYSSFISGITSGITLTLSNVNVAESSPNLASLVGSSAAGKLTLQDWTFGSVSSLYMYKQNSYTWIDTLKIDNATFNSLTTIKLENVQVNTLDIDASISSSNVITIDTTTTTRVKKLVVSLTQLSGAILSNPYVRIDRLCMPTYNTVLENIDMDFSVHKICSAKEAFKNSTLITGLTAEMTINFENTKLSSVSQTYEGMFENVAWLTKLNITGGNVYLNMSKMFYGCSNLTAVSGIFTAISAGGSLVSMFEGCSSLVTAPKITTGGSVSYFPELDVTRMFYGCSSLTEISVRIWAAGGDMKNMCYGCNALNKFEFGGDLLEYSPYMASSWTNALLVDYTILESISFKRLYFNNLTAFNDLGLFFDNANTGVSKCFLAGVNSTCSVTWPDYITFSKLTAEETFAFVGCKAGVGANFVKNFVSSNKTITVTIDKADYDTLTEAQITKFTSNGGVLNYYEG